MSAEPQMEVAPAKHPGGRPRKFTSQNIRTILRCARRGLPLTLCAAAVGVSSQGLINWRKANPRFELALQSSIAKGMARRLGKIVAASENQDWRAAAWLLEHTAPQHFAVSRQLLEVSGPSGGPLAQVAFVLQWPHQQTGHPNNQIGDQDADHHLTETAPRTN
jgi:hypothetical protein